MYLHAPLTLCLAPSTALSRLDAGSWGRRGRPRMAVLSSRGARPQTRETQAAPGDGLVSTEHHRLADLVAGATTPTVQGGSRPPAPTVTRGSIRGRTPSCERWLSLRREAEGQGALPVSVSYTVSFTPLRARWTDSSRLTEPRPCEPRPCAHAPSSPPGGGAPRPKAVCGPAPPPGPPGVHDLSVPSAWT